MLITELANKINKLLDLYVEEQEKRGYWHLHDLKESVRDIKSHLGED